MHHQLIIRPIRMEEAPEVKRLIYAVAHPLMEPQVPLEELMDRWEGWGVFADLDDIQRAYFANNGIFLVAEVDGRVVGTGGFQQYADGQLFEPGGRLRSSVECLRTGAGLCEVRRITLLPEFRGQKIGYALMQELIRLARTMGYTRIVLWTDPIKLHRAVDFYHQLGFQDTPIDGLDPDELWLDMKIA
jgi:GNAT superfamily N-acetyltransferase